MLPAPRFWWRRPGAASLMLAPLGAVVGAIALRRMGEVGESVPVPVICVGNPTVGGAGKTPTATALLRLLTARGARPFALLRGHGGSARGPLRVDLARHTAADVGDEALLLARHAPTIVAGSDRIGGARLAVAEGASHVVMDDGFQNPSLHKDVSLLVVDGAVGVGNGCVTPAGPLRAPLGPQLKRADAVLVVGQGAPGAGLAAAARRCGRVVLQGHLVPEPDAVAKLRRKPLYAFAGIGRPEKFFATLEQEGLVLAGRCPFADHHPYRREEIAALAAEAARLKARLVTTEKDMARLTTPAFSGLTPAIATLPVALQVTEPEALERLIETAEARCSRRCASGGDAETAR